VTQDLRDRSQRDYLEEIGEYQEQRDTENDLRCDQQEEHEEVRRLGAPAPPARKTDWSTRLQRFGRRGGACGGASSSVDETLRLQLTLAEPVTRAVSRSTRSTRISWSQVTSADPT
jgi:hypothetical protein